jgi:hypothetical protein
VPLSCRDVCMSALALPLDRLLYMMMVKRFQRARSDMRNQPAPIAMDVRFTCHRSECSLQLQTFVCRPLYT